IRPPHLPDALPIFADGLQKAGHAGRGLGGVQQPEGDGVAPVHRQDLEQGVDVAPVLHRHQHAVVVFALVEGVHAVEIKVHDLDLGMVFPQIVPQQAVCRATASPAPRRRLSIVSSKLPATTSMVWPRLARISRAASRVLSRGTSWSLTSGSYWCTLGDRLARKWAGGMGEVPMR